MVNFLVNRKVGSLSFLLITMVCAQVATSGQQMKSSPKPVGCQLAEINGEVKAGESFREAIGGGLEFRLLALPGKTGWDIQMDQIGRVSYPDYVELATPPYRSMNQREVATTFGVRAQEAISWNPRSFHFVTNPQQAAIGAKSFAIVAGIEPKHSPSEWNRAQTELAAVLSHAAEGELKIVDARIVQGIGDPAPGTTDWSDRLARTSHVMENADPGKQSPTGELRWIRFRLRLWLPEGWAVPKSIAQGKTSCQH